MKNLRARKKTNSIPESCEAVIKELKDFGMLKQRSIFHDLLRDVRQILENEPNVLLLSSPITIVGDIHGQFYDMLTILEKYGHPPGIRYLFLGDYVDRGMFGVQVLTYLLILKLKYPKSVSLLRGNHECRTITMSHNFEKECRFTSKCRQTYQLVMELFDCLPLAAIVDDRFFCVHAGISPELCILNQLQRINRFTEIPCEGLMCDLLWSDPTDEKFKEWRFNKLRACSYFYTSEHAASFLADNRLKMIIRGHEVQLEGYRYQEFENFRGTKPTLTIFSAPNYCDRYKNKGAIAKVTQGDLQIFSFDHVDHPLVLPNFQNVIQWSIPLIANCATNVLFRLLSKKISRKAALDKKTIAQIKSEMEGMQRIKVMQSMITHSMQNYKKDSFAQKDTNDISETMGEVIKFLVTKERDNSQQAYPMRAEEKKLKKYETEGEQKKQNVNPNQISEKKIKVNRLKSFGPKIKKFVKIQQKTLD